VIVRKCESVHVLQNTGMIFGRDIDKAYRFHPYLPKSIYELLVAPI
jgi:hypothetical protein